MTPLRKRMLEDMQLQNLAESTQKAYVAHVAEFAKFYGKSPDLLGPEEVRAYLQHLKANGSEHSARLAIFALRFLYKRTLGVSWPILTFPVRHPKEKGLPTVLSQSEMALFFGAITARYTQVSTKILHSTVSPLDRLSPSQRQHQHRS